MNRAAPRPEPLQTGLPQEPVGPPPPLPPVPAAQAWPELDLALRIGSGDDLPPAPALQPLLGEAEWLTGAAAEERWAGLLRLWLAELTPELPVQCRAPAYSLGLLLTDDATIAALNGQWRQRPEPTDVLAFAALESLEPEGFPLVPAPPSAAGIGQPPEPLELGDIVISLQTAARQAEASGGALPEELLFLASHGLLHLLGWDHPDEAALEAMLQRQAALIALLRP